MKVLILSSQECEDIDARNGDCIVIDNGKEIVIYDCGSEDYAYWVIEYMERNGYSSAKVVLSHNDDDHFLGIPVLIKERKVSEITTVLLLKYADEVLDLIDDKRRRKEKLKEQIKNEYDNINNLSGNNLKDAFDYINITDGVKLCGPGKDYILKAAAKGLDTTEGDIIDGVTIKNATSIHLEVDFGTCKLLLTGDSSFESVQTENLEEFKVIQLPHHGNAEVGMKILEETKNEIEKIYIISDNTGNSNGGSDNLNANSFDVRNTKVKGMLILDKNELMRSRIYKGNLCTDEISYI